MLDKNTIEQSLKRASEVYPLLMKEVNKIQTEMEELNKNNDNEKELYIRAQKLAKYAADLLAIDTEIATLNYILGKTDHSKLPSQRYDIHDDGEYSKDHNSIESD